jgi:hypothetical protein
MIIAIISVLVLALLVALGVYLRRKRGVFGIPKLTIKGDGTAPGTKIYLNGRQLRGVQRYSLEQNAVYTSEEHSDFFGRLATLNLKMVVKPDVKLEDVEEVIDTKLLDQKPITPDRSEWEYRTEYDYWRREKDGYTFIIEEIAISGRYAWGIIEDSDEVASGTSKTFELAEKAIERKVKKLEEEKAEEKEYRNLNIIHYKGHRVSFRHSTHD